MTRTLSVALGGCHAMAIAPAAVPHTALYAAIESHLHGSTASAGNSVRARSGAAFGIALSLALVPFAGAGAATIEVDSASATVAVDASCTLPEAVQNANDNAATHADCMPGTAGLDTIVFDSTLASSVITLAGTLVASDELALVGPGSADTASALTIDGYGQRIIESLAYVPLTVSGLKLVNGRADSDFNAIFDGGAIYARAPLEVTDSVFENNDAKYAGGAIFARDTLIVTDSTFAGNRAGIENDDAHGGAIFAAGPAQITGSTFYGNRANGAGGAVFVETSGTITDSTFTYNEGYSGGAVFAGVPEQPYYAVAAKGIVVPQAVAVTVSGSSFDSNLAYDTYGTPVGGALAFMPPAFDSGLAHTLAIDDSVFQNNAALAYSQQVAATVAAAAKGAKGAGKYGDAALGGGLAVISGTPQAPLASKGVPVPDTLSVQVDGATFSGNFAMIGGGAALSTSSVTLAGSSFSGNTALIGGGAILGFKYSGYSALSNTVAISDTAVTGNSAALIGGLSAIGMTVSGTNLTVTGNISGEPAYEPPAATTAAKGIIGPLPVFECSTKYSGPTGAGGLALMGASSLTLGGDNTIADNCAGNSGGAVLMVGPGGAGSVSAGTVISGNSAYGSTGGAQLYANDGATLVFAGSVTGNSAGRVAGLQVGTYGTGSVTLDAATISGNTALLDGGGLGLRGGTGSILVSNSTLSGNTAGSGGAAVVEAYADVPTAKGLVAGSIVFENVTVHGNHAVGAPLVTAKGVSGIADGSGGGIAVEDGGQLSLRFATITGNTAVADGGGLWIGASATVDAHNGILAENTAEGAGDDLFGPLTATFTLVGDATAVVAGSNNDIGGIPLLGPLQDNGGPTQTRQPLAGSDAIDSGDPAFAPPPASDQRGSGFPRVQGSVVDKGAVEADPLVTALAIAVDPLTEGAATALTVSLSGTATSDVLVTVDFSGTAVFDTDFTSGDDDALTPGVQVLIAAGSSSGDVVLGATADNLDEVDETLTAAVGAISGPAAESGDVEDTITILDADPAPTLSIDDVTVAESSGNATFSITLSAPSSLPISVDFDSSDGSALAGQDYVAVSGTRVFAPGETLAQVVVPVTADGVDEPDETFVVDLSAPLNAIIGDGQGVGTITDANAAPTVTLSLLDSVLVEEGGSTQLVATLSAVSAQDVTVTLAWSGTAVLGTDYSAGLQIVIPAGALSGALAITTIDDSAVEGNESIVVDIAAVTNATESGVQQATATIDDSADLAAEPGTGPGALPAPAIIPTLSEWMLMLLGLLLPATVAGRLRRREAMPGKRRV